MIWYTSDLHFGHAKLAEFRGFDSADHHDAHVVNVWNDMVRDDDTVWVLGDVCVGSGGLDSVRLLKGTKRLVAGNHDAVHPMHRNAAKSQAKWLSYFDSVQPYARRISSGHEFLMAHHPYIGDHTPTDRDTQWRLPDHGVPILHGHVHAPYTVSWTHKGTQQIHVGWDAWGHPVVEGALLNLIAQHERKVA